MRGLSAGLKLDTNGSTLRYFFGALDKAEEQALERLLQPGQVVYDVGANIGFYAIGAARRVGTAGKVYAFEPVPALAHATRENARRNGLKNIDVIESAVGNVNGEISINLSSNTSMNSIRWGAENRTGIAVPIIKLDDFVKRDGVHPPNIILIDVEGAEVDVFQGMLDVMKHHRPTVITEVHWLKDEIVRFRDNELNSIGYQITMLDGSPLPSDVIRYHALLTPTPVF